MTGSFSLHCFSLHRQSEEEAEEKGFERKGSSKGSERVFQEMETTWTNAFRGKIEEELFMGFWEERLD